jgi:N-acetyl-1-D-myo-inositol-2-amino-2-deoxy-alpha-D-glucopyranoside deacetylase
MSGGVLALFAHPDDESLLAGGALAGLAAAGLRVAIVSMTRGERGPMAASAAGGEAALAEVREAELRTAAEALGASSAECLDFPDGELVDADEERAVGAIADLMERERPSGVIGFSADGLYWHPDHLAASRFMLAALDRKGPGVPAYGATWPEGHAGRLASLMRSRGLPTDLWGIEPGAVGAPAGTITTTIDVRPFLPAKLAALRRYRTQVAPSHLLGALPDDLADEFLGDEYFVRLTRGESDPDWLAAVLEA